MTGALETTAAPSFLRSAFSREGAAIDLVEFHSWLSHQRRSKTMVVREVPLETLHDWSMTGEPSRIAHASSRFFTIEGVRVDTDFGPLSQWEQPIIRQPEIGILGIITQSIDGVPHFLMQAKNEPGNAIGVQLAPTLQATHSNYTRVHRGNAPPYLDSFLNARHAIVDQLQSEHASRYLGKQNRNMIVEADNVQQQDGFCWLTLGQLHRLLRIPNLVNMDARSVLSCLPLARGESFLFAERASTFGRALLRSLVSSRSTVCSEEAGEWLGRLRGSYRLSLERRPVHDLDQWEVREGAIRHVTGRYFSVVGVDVEADGREVTRWQQPLLRHSARGINGFLTQEHDGVLHFLVRACMYPGNAASFELGPTVSLSDPANPRRDVPPLPFLSLFLDPPSQWVRYLTEQSEEGGRFLHYVNSYVILEAPAGVPIEVPETHRWMTLGQIKMLIARGYLNVEARSLIACLDFLDET